MEETGYVVSRRRSAPSLGPDRERAEGTVLVEAWLGRLEIGHGSHPASTSRPRASRRAGDSPSAPIVSAAATGSTRSATRPRWSRCSLALIVRGALATARLATTD